MVYLRDRLFLVVLLFSMLMERRQRSELPNLGRKAESRLAKPKRHEIGVDANITLDVEGEQGVNA